MRSVVFIFSTVLLAGALAARADQILENDYVKVTISPDRGGAVTSMIYKKATTFALIADKGAGVAATGRLFVPQVNLGNAHVDLADVKMTGEPSKGPGEVVLKGKLPASAGELDWTRTFSLDPDESGLRITDTFRNPGNEISMRLGMRANIQGEEWRNNLRHWVGDAQQVFTIVAPPMSGQGWRLAAKGPTVFWRGIGPLGVGFLYSMELPGGKGEVNHVLPALTGCPATFDATSDLLQLAKGAELRLSSSILIDEGGRQSNDPSKLTWADRILSTVDVRAAGKSGDSMPGGVTLVSARPAKVKVTVTQYRLDAGKKADAKTIAQFDETLSPGKSVYRLFQVPAQSKGWWHVEATVADEKGNVRVVQSAKTLIDGEGMEDPEARQVWKLYSMKMPETAYKGTWEEIGAPQWLKRGGSRAKPQASEYSKQYMQFLDKKFPYYARMLRGAAAQLKVEPERLADAQGIHAPTEACMNVFFEGPDGPINAFSKERVGTDLTGLTYTKVVPDSGYRFHYYLGAYGVNNAGLSVSGASLNADQKTEDNGPKEASEWRKSGKFTAPPFLWMIMATCKNVDEALKYLEDPEAPVESVANLLFVDKEGNAAHVEISGIQRQIFRYDKTNPEGFCVSGNYTHPRADGWFGIGDWPWAANTMLRERFIWNLAGKANGKHTLADVIAIMETHGAGGMCQHLYDNPGGLYSNTSFVAVPRTGELFLSHGPACRVHYERYTLDQ